MTWPRGNRTRGISSEVREPAVAGRFYEGNARRLADAVDGYVAAARAASGTGRQADGEIEGATQPGRVAVPGLRAVVVPHAGHIFSGPIAGFGFAAVAAEAIGHPVRCVVMLGPAHFVPVPGIGSSTATAWRTPLGDVRLATDMAESLLADLPHAGPADQAHGPEHSLEVQVPFLQRVLEPGFAICPLLVGMDLPGEVATVVTRAAATPGVLVLLSTDLSHYLDLSAARAHDDRTIEAVTARNPNGIGERDACGRLPLRGLLTAARDLDWQVRLLDARTSGDTAGGPDRVVGYAAFAVTGAEPRPAETPRSAEVPRSPAVPRSAAPRPAGSLGSEAGVSGVSVPAPVGHVRAAPHSEHAISGPRGRADEGAGEASGLQVLGGQGGEVCTGGAWTDEAAAGAVAGARESGDPSLFARPLSAAEQWELLAVARGTIEQALATRRRPRFDGSTVSDRLQRPGAAFVTIRSGSGELLGCIGSLAPTRELVADVAGHAYDAAFRDPRFPPLTPGRAARIRLAISVLTPARPFPAADYDDLVARLPRGSGLTVIAPGHRATFLPVVWDDVGGSASFVKALWRKAGLLPRAWPEQIRLEVYSAQEFEED